ncbi:hypothetical protein J3R83DRAFT_1403 [Lanmaoa asiatica]|nr:hypothetical protein J3R83DRAFT_1403 [Lanmaoa asiatica]
MISVRLPKILGTTGAGQLLRGDQLLGTVFNDVSFSATPRVVIEWLDDSKQGIHGADLHSPTFTGRVHKRKNGDHEEADCRMVELVTRAKIANDAPSTISRPQSFKTLRKRKKRILDYRHPYPETLSDLESSGDGHS